MKKNNFLLADLKYNTRYLLSEEWEVRIYLVISNEFFNITFTLLILFSPSDYPGFYPVIVSAFASVKFLALLAEFAVMAPALIIYLRESRDNRPSLSRNG